MYQTAYETALIIHRISEKFPDGEFYRITSYLRRSSHMACFNIGEALRKKNNPHRMAFRLRESFLNIMETLRWLRYARSRGYIAQQQYNEIRSNYIAIGFLLGKMLEMPRKPFPRRRG